MPNLCRSTTALGAEVRGHDAWQVLMTTVPQANDIARIDELVCFAWLGTQADRDAVSARRAIVVAEVLAAVGAKAAPPAPPAAKAAGKAAAKAAGKAAAKAAAA